MRTPGEPRARLIRVYGRLFHVTEAAINKVDPIGLLNIGCPADEYDLEIGTVLPRLSSARSVEDVETILHEEFVRAFGQRTGGVRSSYRAPAGQI
jgi:hypothetical protein